MENFKLSKVKLEAASVSEQLRLARQIRGLTLGQVAQFLEISPKFLHALESSRYDELPKGMYGRNYLREYTTFLGLNYKELLSIFEKEKVVLGYQVDKDDYFVELKPKQKIVLFIPGIFKNIAILLSIIIGLLYFSGAILKIFSPPTLFVFNPSDNLITENTSINIDGLAEAQSQITINGDLIASTNGAFQRIVYLRKGINTINITASRKFGQPATIERKILVKDANPKNL
ncbi:MAG: helix-turn-helix domain-containing protein [Candidatus Falkowbacteria bacterium]|nr:helix-turn-helix domain-containing protein [Candidatus Falkowbacteria bacterium]